MSSIQLSSIKNQLGDTVFEFDAATNTINVAQDMLFIDNGGVIDPGDPSNGFKKSVRVDQIKNVAGDVIFDIVDDVVTLGADVDFGQFDETGDLVSLKTGKNLALTKIVDTDGDDMLLFDANIKKITLGDGVEFVTGAAGDTSSFDDVNNLVSLKTGKNLALTKIVDTDGDDMLLFDANTKKITLGDGVGTSSFGINPIGDENINFGKNTLEDIEEGAFSNIAIGTNAGRNITTASDNILIGLNSGMGVDDKPITGIGNIGLGSGSLMRIEDECGYNISIGFDSGANISTGYNNIFLGNASGGGNTDGLNLLSGVDNVGVGGSTFQSIEGASSRNTTFGSNSCRSLRTGNNNVAFGYMAGANIELGSNNVALGSNSGPTTGDLDNTICIGHNATTTTSNTIQLGNSSIATLNCQVALTTTSDIRDKTDIEPVGVSDVLDKINKIDVIQYRFDNRDRYPDGVVPDGSKKDDKLRYGVSAQQIQQLFPEAVVETVNERGDTRLTLDNSALVYMLIKAIQEQNAIIAKL